jgi:hypothetical protein
VGFFVAESGEHSVVKIDVWIGISGHLKIIGAFRGTWGGRLNGRSELRQIGLRLFWASRYVFIYSTTFAFRHGCSMSLNLNSQISRTQTQTQTQTQLKTLFWQEGLPVGDYG